MSLPQTQFQPAAQAQAQRAVPPVPQIAVIGGLDPSASVLAAAELNGQQLRDATDGEHKAAWGQFFTPVEIARFMAGLVDRPERA